MSFDKAVTMTFGILPEEIRSYLIKRFWDNPRTLKQLLKGEVNFPLIIPLKPPTAQAALKEINHFQQFVHQWRQFAAENANEGCIVVFESRKFRDLGEQLLPVQIQFTHFQGLLSELGEEQQQTITAWQVKLQQLHLLLTPSPEQAHALFLAMIDSLDVLVDFDEDTLALLANLILQLKPNMGKGLYLRALPIIGVDTKFLEKNLKTIERLANIVLDPTIEQVGLLTWLGVYDKPKDWLLVRPLSLEMQNILGGLPLMRLSTDTLMRFRLPSQNILVVENEQSCLALPQLTDTIAVAGGGKNIAWLSADWVCQKTVAYWGDIDSEGLVILSDARAKQPTIQALMMDEKTVIQHISRMVEEPMSVFNEPSNLTPSELLLFRQLRARQFGHTRLEQERISADYIDSSLRQWLESLAGVKP